MIKGTFTLYTHNRENNSLASLSSRQNLQIPTKTNNCNATQSISIWEMEK